MTVYRIVQFILFLIPLPLAFYSDGDAVSNSTEKVSKVFYKPTYEVNVQRDVIYGYGLSHDSFNLENLDSARHDFQPNRIVIFQNFQL